MNRPITTLFMLMSVDGKISTGKTDILDIDRDLPKIKDVCEGLRQYYDIEQMTDLWSLNSGRVMAKIGINDKTHLAEKTPVSFVLIDNKPHLNENGVRYLCGKLRKLVVVTTNKNYPQYDFANFETLHYDRLNLANMLCDLKSKYGVDKLTIQTGGTLNGIFLREGLFDYIHIIIAPIAIGGKDTSTLIDGESITSLDELPKLAPLCLLECKKLEHSYLELVYKVVTT